MIVTAIIVIIASLASAESCLARSNITTALAQSLRGIADALIVVDDQQVPDYQPTPLYTSCNQIKEHYPKSRTGYYRIVRKGEVKYVHCYMEELCGSGEGWTALSYLNMTDPIEKCPDGLTLYQSNGIRACVSKKSNNCTTFPLPSIGISYSKLCVRVVDDQHMFRGKIDKINAVNAEYVENIKSLHYKRFYELKTMDNHVLVHHKVSPLWFSDAVEPITITDRLELMTCKDTKEKAPSGKESVPVVLYEIYVQ